MRFTYKKSSKRGGHNELYGANIHSFVGFPSFVRNDYTSKK